MGREQSLAARPRERQVSGAQSGETQDSNGSGLAGHVGPKAPLQSPDDLTADVTDLLPRDLSLEALGRTCSSPKRKTPSTAGRLAFWPAKILSLSTSVPSH